MGDPQHYFLDEAARAAAVQDINRAVQALVDSVYLDGVHPRLACKWRRLEEPDINDAVANAMVELYDQVCEGKKIDSLEGFLWTVANRKASNIWKSKQRVLLVWDHDRFAASAADHDDEEPERSATPVQYHDQRISVAIALARGLVPELGKGNVYRVMSYIIDAVAAGRWDVWTQRSKREPFVARRLSQPSGLSYSGRPPGSSVGQEPALAAIRLSRSSTSAPGPDCDGRHDACSNLIVNSDVDSFGNFERHRKSVGHGLLNLRSVSTTVDLDLQARIIRDGDRSITVEYFVLNSPSPNSFPVRILPIRCDGAAFNLEPQARAAVTLRVCSYGRHPCQRNSKTSPFPTRTQGRRQGQSE